MKVKTFVELRLIPLLSLTTNYPGSQGGSAAGDAAHDFTSY